MLFSPPTCFTALREATAAAAATPSPKDIKSERPFPCAWDATNTLPPGVCVCVSEEKHRKTGPTEQNDQRYFSPVPGSRKI